MYVPQRRPQEEFETYDADDPRAYGIDGLLRPGCKIRVPMQMMDAASLPFARTAPPRPAALPFGPAPMVIGVANYKDSPLREFYHRDGTRKSRRVRDRDRDRTHQQKDAVVPVVNNLATNLVDAAMNDPAVSSPKCNSAA
jgi:hypothetical protein